MYVVVDVAYRYTLSNRPEAVAALLAAFFPRLPIHSNDNRYHLQALRHLYVLAAEPRLVTPRDVDTDQICYVPLHIMLKVCIVTHVQYSRIEF